MKKPEEFSSAKPKCPACGGATVRARIKTKEFVCIGCGNVFKPAEVAKG